MAAVPLVIQQDSDMSKNAKSNKAQKTTGKQGASRMYLYIGLALIVVLGIGVMKGGMFGPAQTEGVLYAQPSEFHAGLQQPGAVLVDVRTLGEWNRGHLPQARRIELEQLEGQITAQAPDRNTPVLVYCQSGTRSAFAASILRRMGYTKVTNLVGGIESWSRAGGPIVND